MQSVFSRLLSPYYRVCQHQQYVNTHVFISCMLCSVNLTFFVLNMCFCVCTVYTVCMCMCVFVPHGGVCLQNHCLVFTVVCPHVFFVFISVP